MKTYSVKAWKNHAYRLVRSFNSLTAAYDFANASKRNEPSIKLRLLGKGGSVLRTF